MGFIGTQAANKLFTTSRPSSKAADKVSEAAVRFLLCIALLITAASAGPDSVVASCASADRIV